MGRTGLGPFVSFWRDGTNGDVVKGENEHDRVGEQWSPLGCQGRPEGGGTAAVVRPGQQD